MAEADGTVPSTSCGARKPPVWELGVRPLSPAQEGGKHSSFSSAEEGVLCCLPCPSQSPLELPKGLFGSTEALVYLIQKDFSVSSPLMF